VNQSTHCKRQRPCSVRTLRSGWWAQDVSHATEYRRRSTVASCPSPSRFRSRSTPETRDRGILGWSDAPTAKICCKIQTSLHFELPWNSPQFVLINWFVLPCFLAHSTGYRLIPIICFISGFMWLFVYYTVFFFLLFIHLDFHDFMYIYCIICTFVTY